MNKISNEDLSMLTCGCACSCNCNCSVQCILPFGYSTDSSTGKDDGDAMGKEGAPEASGWA